MLLCECLLVGLSLNADGFTSRLCIMCSGASKSMCQTCLPLCHAVKWRQKSIYVCSSTIY